MVTYAYNMSRMVNTELSIFTISNCTKKMSCVRGQPVPGYSAGCAPQEGQKQGLVGLDIQEQTPGPRELSE